MLVCSVCSLRYVFKCSGLSLHAECKSFCSPVYIRVHCIHFRVAMTESQSKRTTDLLEIFDYEGLERTEISCETLLQNLKRKLNIELCMVTNEKFTKDTTITRQVMASWLRKSVEIMRSQASLLCSYKDIVDTMKNDAIADKNKVLTVQEKLLEMKDQQLDNLKSAVQSTVQNSVETEIKQYSQVLTQNSTGNGVCHDTLEVL